MCHQKHLEEKTIRKKGSDEIVAEQWTNREDQARKGAEGHQKSGSGLVSSGHQEPFVMAVRPSTSYGSSDVCEGVSATRCEFGRF